VPSEQRGPALTRWSLVAQVAVALVVATGTLQALREIDEPAQLTSTVYGRLLLVKLALVAGMLVLGALGRRWVRRSAAGRPVAGPGFLRGQVGAEVTLGVAVLALTSALSTTAPAKDTYSPALHETVRAAAARVRVDIPHTRRGDQRITLHVTDATGRPLQAAQITGAYYEDDKDLGPLPVDFRLGPAGTAQAVAQVLVPGRWRLRVIVRTSDIAAGIADLIYRVR
jgi:copper transport protein